MLCSPPCDPDGLLHGIANFFPPKEPRGQQPPPPAKAGPYKVVSVTPPQSNSYIKDANGWEIGGYIGGGDTQ